MGQDYTIVDHKVTGSFEDRKWSATFKSRLSEDSIDKELLVIRAILILDNPLMGEPNTNLWTFKDEAGSILKIFITSDDSSCTSKYLYVAQVWQNSQDTEAFKEQLQKIFSYPHESADGPNVLFSMTFLGPRPVFGGTHETFYLAGDHRNWFHLDYAGPHRDEPAQRAEP